MKKTTKTPKINATFKSYEAVKQFQSILDGMTIEDFLLSIDVKNNNVIFEFIEPDQADEVMNQISDICFEFELAVCTFID